MTQINKGKTRINLMNRIKNCYKNKICNRLTIRNFMMSMKKNLYKLMTIWFPFNPFWSHM